MHVLERLGLRKPKFDQELRDEIDLYSIDQLRAEYHAAADTSIINLRNSIAKRDEVKAEIRWRVHREACRFWLLATLAFVAAVASAIAAVATLLSLRWGQ